MSRDWTTSSPGAISPCGLDAFADAVSTLKSALTDFYNSLTDE